MLGLTILQIVFAVTYSCRVLKISFGSPVVQLDNAMLKGGELLFTYYHIWLSALECQQSSAHNVLYGTK
jgi:hypothetical protein